MLQKTRVRYDPTRPDHDLRPGSWLLWYGKSLWCRQCFASQIAAAEAERDDQESCCGGRLIG
jgi:hypothetical protein